MISVVIPSHGRPILLGRTLASLGACELPDAYAETIVIENGPKAGAEAVVRDAAAEHPHLKLRYMHVDVANKSQALNHALETVPHGLVVFFDDDVLIQSSALKSYETVAGNHRLGHFFGGAVSVQYEEAPPDWIRAALPQSALGCSESELESGAFAFGTNWAAYVQDLRAVGGFDIAFGPGSALGAAGQETEMQKRLTKAGGTFVVIPDATVEHFVSRTRSSARWIIARRYRLGVSTGQRIARREKRNTLVRDGLWALRSSCLLPIYWLARDQKKVFGHCLNVARAAGMFRGYLWMRRNGRRVNASQEHPARAVGGH